MEQQRSGRIDFIDLTKGLCIMLVVMVHVGGAFERLDAGSLISCFLMPLYFFTSGLFFKSYEGLTGFTARKIDKLLIPFLVFYLGAFLLMYTVSKVMPGAFRLPVHWSELLLVFKGHELIRFNPPFWFMVALFNCNLMFYIVHYLRKKYLPAMFLVVLMIGVTGFWLGKERIELPFYIDVAMTALPFYFAGFWVRRYNFFLFPHHRFDKIIPLVVLVGGCVWYFMARPVGMRTNSYGGDITHFYAAAFAGIFTIMLLCKRMKNIRLISYLGRYSIVTLGIHGPLLFFFRPVISRVIPTEGWSQSILLFVVTLATCLILTPFIVRYMPQIVAQKDVLKDKVPQRKTSENT